MKSKFNEQGEHGPWKITGQNKKTLNILNDLIRINIDRITGYEKAAHAETTPEPEIRDIFYRMATDSRAYVNTLHAEVLHLGGAPVTQSTISGKIHLHWLEGKNSFDGVDTPSRLGASLAAELAVQKAYEQALDEQNHLPPPIHDLVENQSWGLERSYQRLAVLSESFNQTI
jgi:uncharacterized protein (TIGR02284 family)